MTTNEAIITASRYNLQREAAALMKEGYTPEEALSKLDIL